NILEVLRLAPTVAGFDFVAWPDDEYQLTYQGAPLYKTGSVEEGPSTDGRWPCGTQDPPWQPGDVGVYYQPDCASAPGRREAARLMLGAFVTANAMCNAGGGDGFSSSFRELVHFGQLEDTNWSSNGPCWPCNQGAVQTLLRPNGSGIVAEQCGAGTT